VVVRLAAWKRTERGRPCMAPVAQPTAFGALLRQLRVAARLSQHALAVAAAVDPAYVNRLERAEPGPSRRVVCRLWLALSDDDDALDGLLAAAGLLPACVVRAGGWDCYLRGWRGQVRTLERKLELRDAHIRDQARRLADLHEQVREVRRVRS
jgi:transcriptional regulator with XRE-family HTH domain